MSSRRSSYLALFIAVASSLAAGCSASPQDPDSTELTEDAGTNEEGVTGNLKVGAELKTTANVNLRAGASTDDKILHVIPKGSSVVVQLATPTNGFYKVKHDGTVGWMSGQYGQPTGGESDPVATDQTFTATADVNLRNGPGTTYEVIAVVPTGKTVKVVNDTPQNGFYNVDYNGKVGWSSGKFYTQGAGGGSDPGGSDPGSGNAAIDAALARGKAAVGFSYWWGHGRFKAGGPAGSPGSCSGSCPNCSHSGSYGGDCSGLTAKVWQVPASNDDVTIDSHPYSTAVFVKDSSQWKTVSRDSLKAADALVYNNGGAGHIFVYKSGDGWGSMYAYECRGCSAGCIGGLRTASSSYHGIRKVGF